MLKMRSDKLFEYNHKKKMVSGIIAILSFVGILLVIGGIYLFFNRLTFLRGTFITQFINFIKVQIFNRSILGAFLLSAVGGLFFIPTPLEAVLPSFLLNNPNTLYLIIFYMFGIILSYSMNLFIGYKFSNFSRKLISTKKFYEIKVKLNKYGKLGVFLINLIPFAPSQQVSLILGVFRYNKTKFYIYFISGQLLKVLGMTLFVLFSSRLFQG